MELEAGFEKKGVASRGDPPLFEDLGDPGRDRSDGVGLDLMLGFAADDGLPERIFRQMRAVVPSSEAQVDRAHEGDLAVDDRELLVVAPAEGCAIVEQIREFADGRKILERGRADAAAPDPDDDGRPSRSRARWTCASDAAAIGRDSKSRKALERRIPSCSCTIRSDSSDGNGSTSSCSRASASRYAGGRRSARVERSRANLT